ncbi:PREDICTED: hybrid signal transduction histidine kinase A isoform X1 [Rhagoletis zephyria]|uniref:hybrid signal transduction histidine kinase A isoform X1 n=1 Tax=Rhagoletis zephyria TaxID=28612 RepID=UPI000811377C|nr:PREDICTED: hybrid signal transduction histidine kinase A isoform X1 [Rhagoletis zephyria]
MNSRNKRARLEFSVAPTNIDAGIGNGCAMNTNQLASNIIGTQNIFLSNTTNSATNNTVSMLPANVFLTICDENSDESEDYLAIGSTLTQIKQEHEDALCLGNVNSSSSTQATQTLPVQYRIVNQMQRQLHSVDNTLASDSVVSTNESNGLSATLPMHLPNSCEIYIVKEYVDNMPTILPEDSELLQGPPSPMTNTTTAPDAIKLEPDSSLTSTAGAVATTSASTSINGVQILRNTPLPCMITNKLSSSTANERINSISNKNNAAVTAINSGDIQGNSTKRSCILEAYKKRDDKRRATHNEVERRRRDKINNWIFKLKEMLPSEGASNNNNSNNQLNSLVEQMSQKSNTTNSSGNSNASNNSNNGNSNRTPPSDSKSQILIKACEYIKTMQDEIKSLRECLSENENLRLSNQRLQNELNKMQSERAAAAASATLHTRSFNSNFNITLNSLNSNNSNGSAGLGGGGTSGGVDSASNSPGGGGSIFSSLNITPNVSSTNTYTKRELIIRDYVD